MTISIEPLPWRREEPASAAPRRRQALEIRLHLERSRGEPSLHSPLQAPPGAGTLPASTPDGGHQRTPTRWTARRRAAHPPSDARSSASQPCRPRRDPRTSLPRRRAPSGSRSTSPFPIEVIDATHTSQDVLVELAPRRRHRGRAERVLGRVVEVAPEVHAVSLFEAHRTDFEHRFRRKLLTAHSPFHAHFDWEPPQRARCTGADGLKLAARHGLRTRPAGQLRRAATMLPQPTWSLGARSSPRSRRRGTGGADALPSGAPRVRPMSQWNVRYRYVGSSIHRAGDADRDGGREPACDSDNLVGRRSVDR